MFNKIKKSLHYNLVIFLLLLALFTKFVASYLPLLVILSIISILFLYKSTFKILIYFSLCISLLITILIIGSLIVETYNFFNLVSPIDFLFGTQWKPYFTVYNGEIRKLFGILPLLNGTILIALIAILVAAPIGICTAILLNYFTSEKLCSVIKPLIQVMAAIPTVVYGYFALHYIVPFIISIGNFFDIKIATENALTTGFIIGIMITPLISSLIDDILHSVPKSLYYGAAALGSTQTEIILHIAIPFALPGILSSILLAFSRAIGETMIVLMLMGVSAKLDFNPLDSLTTITVQIATILTGDQTFNSEESLSAYGLGFTLFIITWLLNAIAIKAVKRCENQY